jgi:GT2 family glycosyltransferase
MHKTSLAAPPQVDIIVITFNGTNHLDRCFRAIQRTNYPNYRTILLDNGSTDGCADLVADRYPDCQIIRTGKNLGFAGGNNVAMRLSLEGQAEFVVLLNDDSYICDPEWLSRAVAAAADPTVAMVGFEVIQGGGVYDPSLDRSIASLPASPVGVGRIEGSSLFIRTAVLRQIGLLDEIYFMYGEEDDLEMRAKRAGYGLVKTNSVVFHIGGGTSRRYPVKIAYYQSRNYLRYAFKNLSALRALQRIVALGDILCNPFPIVYRSDDRQHIRMRSSGSLLLNCGIYGLALAWNAIHLPQTLMLRFQRNHSMPNSTASRAQTEP